MLPRQFELIVITSGVWRVMMIFLCEESIISWSIAVTMV